MKIITSLAIMRDGVMRRAKILKRGKRSSWADGLILNNNYFIPDGIYHETGRILTTGFGKYI